MGAVGRRFGRRFDISDAPICIRCGVRGVGGWRGVVRYLWSFKLALDYIYPYILALDIIYPYIKARRSGNLGAKWVEEMDPLKMVEILDHLSPAIVMGAVLVLWAGDWEICVH